MRTTRVRSERKGLRKGQEKAEKVAEKVFCANAREIYEIDLEKSGSFGRDFERKGKIAEQFIEFVSNLSPKAFQFIEIKKNCKQFIAKSKYLKQNVEYY